MCEGGLPEAARPLRCGFCPSERMPHRHGKFMRWLFTLDEAFQIPVFRFLCPDCRKTVCVLPAFVEPHHQSAVDVKEEIVRAGAEGRSLTEVAVHSDAFAGGRYSEKTLWRWQQCWKHRRKKHEQRLWSAILHHGMDVSLPRERRSGWKALFAAWSALARPEPLFSSFLRLDRLPALTAPGLRPTKAGHG